VTGVQTCALPIYYREIGPKEYQAEYQAKDPNEYVLLDVRRPSEYEAGHIEGAILMNIEDPDFPQKVAKLDKDKTYYINCRSGARSGRACQYMASQGFGDTINLKGGILAWQDANLPVKQGSEQ